MWHLILFNFWHDRLRSAICFCEKNLFFCWTFMDYLRKKILNFLEFMNVFVFDSEIRFPMVWDFNFSQPKISTQRSSYIESIFFGTTGNKFAAEPFSKSLTLVHSSVCYYSEHSYTILSLVAWSFSCLGDSRLVYSRTILSVSLRIDFRLCSLQWVFLNCRFRLL